MQVIKSIAELRAVVRKWRQSGETIALVPTMGNLHKGHLRLVQEAQKSSDHVVVSIFVNPTQFGAGEDFASYPRTEQCDLQQLEDIKAEVIFLPSVTAIFPPDANTIVHVKELSDVYCGASRPGHFIGVATIVCKLLNMAQPDCAFFGEKDFQQLMVIRCMVRDLNIPVEIQGIATIRENDGLAMSSRNAYLTDAQRMLAPNLYRSLCQARSTIMLKQTEYRFTEQQQIQLLQNDGFQVDYFCICNSRNLKPASLGDSELIILSAARLGKSRLIDNIRVSRH